MMLTVEQPGVLSTVQDIGRTGWRHLGVARAGALDPDAARLANRLVGNPADAAVLEFTLIGPTLWLDAPTTIALCGAEADVVHTDAGGTRTLIGAGRPVGLPPGSLRIGRLRRGIRGWLAVKGGLRTPEMLGSRSTDLRGGFGGHAGRALARGDALQLGPGDAVPRTQVRQPRWWVEFDPLPGDTMIVRFVPLPHADGIARQLASRPWRVDARSNRQGLRLQGEPLPVPAGDIVSAAVAPGTIQLPPDGQPIVLLADAQTTGGYRRLGHVVASDLPRLAQAGPGTGLHWIAVDTDTGASLRRARLAQWRRLEYLLDERLRSMPDG
ncbi:biotin-dependent carboxyltransferase family protein [Marilutibacter chinensis]|uniref:Biotin-dependent carboxyltransferase family protein n=1 Tax=Marilutibacter chinensis TaxID=2912247 RepID=A0ABS9HWB3_9GAMM|nr:biotin-dependent carboxyltransferase family protein [Lysobacter chinensis]MCF7223194.1 biotin-dependent carboxyltransferase family protein [Lysobacter chinensis]